MTEKDKKNILIIEDDEALSGILNELLEQEDFKVSVAYKGTDGFDMAIKLQPDLIILDLMLPEMNGREVLEKIRKEESIADTSVFVLTNVGDIESIVNISEIGKTFYFLKVDISLEEILKQIKLRLGMQDTTDY